MAISMTISASVEQEAAMADQILLLSRELEELLLRVIIRLRL